MIETPPIKNHSDLEPAPPQSPLGTSSSPRERGHVPVREGERLALLLRDKRAKHVPGSMAGRAPAELRRWGRVFDTLLADRRADLLEEAIIYSQRDTYWAGVITTAGRFKNHIEALLGQLRRTNSGAARSTTTTAGGRQRGQYDDVVAEPRQGDV